MRADEAPSLVIVSLQTREQRARLHHITLPRPPARCLVHYRTVRCLTYRKYDSYEYEYSY